MVAGSYAPAVEGTPDIVGPGRYGLLARYHNGTDLDPMEAYAYGWAEFHRLLAEMRKEAEKVLPGTRNSRGGRCPGATGTARPSRGSRRPGSGSSPDGRGHRRSGQHPLRAGRADPPGGAVHRPAGQCRSPLLHRAVAELLPPGRTWLPTIGETRFPAHDLVTTWYHEGVPGHHLQPAQWAHVAGSLSRHQTTVGVVSANAEGWALYAERLMDELGFPSSAERRLGCLDAQMHRAIRVIVGIGVHLELGYRPTPPSAPKSTGPPNRPRSSWPATAAALPTTSRARSSATSAWRARPSATSPVSGYGSRAGRRPAPGTVRPSTSGPGTWRRCPGGPRPGRPAERDLGAVSVRSPRTAGDGPGIGPRCREETW